MTSTTTKAPYVLDEANRARIAATFKNYRSKTTAEILRLHNGIQGRVWCKYTAAEMGGKICLIGDLLRYHFGEKAVHAFFENK